MAISAPKKTHTIDDLWELSHREGKRYELVKGELVELAPASDEHGYVAGRLLGKVFQYVESARLGYIFAAETGFVLREEPATVRAPDLAYVSRERAPQSWSRQFARFVPDLVAEVVSPADTYSEVMRKVEDWLNAGVKVVWVIDPVSRQVSVHRSGQMCLLREEDTLSGEDVLPGFECKVSEIFAL
ncbi:MAG: Uma2 family endonuclease [Chthonomonadetes bacterium]|nr:Uma2 family endonuclease [Chthonomonadetes bacterium]